MDVDLGSEVLRGHREALDMPSRPPAAPGTIPPRLVGPGSLPHRKVERVLLLAVRREWVRDHVVELLVRQDAERVLRLARSEVDVAVDRVPEAVRNRRLHGP